MNVWRWAGIAIFIFGTVCLISTMDLDAYAGGKDKDKAAEKDKPLPFSKPFMEVIAAVDAPRPTGRLNSMPSDALSRRLDATRAQIEATYRATTVAQFLLENDALVPACSSPA